MTESQRINLGSLDEFARKVLRHVREAREAGIQDADELATALNRSGLPTFRGRQWTGRDVLEFLASPEAVRAESEAG